MNEKRKERLKKNEASTFIHIIFIIFIFKKKNVCTPQKTHKMLSLPSVRLEQLCVGEDAHLSHVESAVGVQQPGGFHGGLDVGCGCGHAQSRV